MLAMNAAAFSYAAAVISFAGEDQQALADRRFEQAAAGA